MDIVTLPEFINIFKNQKDTATTFTEFLKIARVRSGPNMSPLRSYVQDKNIDIADVKILFGHIKNRNDYLTRFYTLSLRIPEEKLHLQKIQPMKNGNFNNNDEVLCKNIIRNIHLLDILKNTKSGIENNPTYMDMLLDLYTRNIVDYKLLTPSAIFYMKNGRLGSVFSSYYFRASIMNPYLVYSLNMSLLHGKRIFTPTLGWTSYCYGFLECPDVVEYVGTDVIPSVCQKTRKFAKAYMTRINTDIYCTPSEDLLKNGEFMSKYKQHFDVVFFSPPYYKLELYDGGKQSTEKYKTYSEWLENYWEKTMQLCHHVLQKGGRLCYILSGYGSENTKEQYDLVTDMNVIAKKYFHLKNIQPMYNKNINNTKHKDPSEKIILFVKK